MLSPRLTIPVPVVPTAVDPKPVTVVVLFLGLLDLNAPEDDVDVAVIIGYLCFCFDEFPL